MRSNTYVLAFMTTITIVLGTLLSLAATSLKDLQDFNVEIDIKKNILKSLDIPKGSSQKLTSEEIQSLFDERIKTMLINADGEESVEGTLPVYVKTDSGVNSGYAIPISGKGLWSTIYGYLALNTDGETIKGITFYKHGETPGLGGEVEKEWFTANFRGKRIVDEEGNLVGIQIAKGQVTTNDPDAYHKVDGISGATMTTKGVNIFLEQDLATYDPFLQKLRASEE
ncbi:NADH:ubiquinone reductase (Na(+)-transporting) subunit C [Candidatus Neomarinimicrobiota bacterium]